MAPEQDLRSILDKLDYTDDARVVEQIAAQTKVVKDRLAGIRNKVVVMSGKGGVGKSMTTVNLALALARAGQKVGLVDVDLNGPCVPQMLGIRGKELTYGPEGAVPPVGPLGVKVASMDFLLNTNAPVRWKGPMDLSPVWLGMTEMNVIREFLSDIVWGELDYLLADLPPGAAADKPPLLSGLISDLAGAVVVTTSFPKWLNKCCSKINCLCARSGDRSAWRDREYEPISLSFMWRGKIRFLKAIRKPCAKHWVFHC